MKTRSRKWCRTCNCFQIFVVKSANVTFAYEISDDEQVHVTDNPKKRSYRTAQWQSSYLSNLIITTSKRRRNLTNCQIAYEFQNYLNCKWPNLKCLQVNYEKEKKMFCEYSITSDSTQITSLSFLIKFSPRVSWNYWISKRQFFRWNQNNINQLKWYYQNKSWSKLSCLWSVCAIVFSTLVTLVRIEFWSFTACRVLILTLMER